MNGKRPHMRRFVQIKRIIHIVPWGILRKYRNIFVMLINVLPKPTFLMPILPTNILPMPIFPTPILISNILPTPAFLTPILRRNIRNRD